MGFFGWENFKWLIREILLTFSKKPSFFSSKRIERSLFVLSGEIALVWFVIIHIHELTYLEIIALVGVWWGAAGYSLNQIEKEKVLNKLPQENKEDGTTGDKETTN